MVSTSVSASHIGMENVVPLLDGVHLRVGLVHSPRHKLLVRLFVGIELGGCATTHLGNWKLCRV